MSRILPRVAVVLPVRNAAPWLGACLESLERQTLAGFTVYAINDASEDESAAVLDCWRPRLGERLRVLPQVGSAPRGISACLNDLIDFSDEPLVARMDADDVAAPDRLRRQAEFMTTHPDVAVCGSAFRLLEDGRPGPVVTPPLDAAAIRARLLFASPFCHPSVCLRRSALQGFAAVYAPEAPPLEDLDLWMRLSRRHSLANLPEPLLSYRLHGGQVTAVSRPELQPALVALRRAFLEGLGFGLRESDLPLLAQTSMKYELRDERPETLPEVSRFLVRMRDSTALAAWCGKRGLRHEVALAWWRCVRLRPPTFALARRALGEHPCLASDPRAAGRFAKLVLAGLKRRVRSQT